jgi:hypothetical protein
VVEEHPRDRDQQDQQEEAAHDVGRSADGHGRRFWGGGAALGARVVVVMDGRFFGSFGVRARGRSVC